jgi:hypothetical protein
MHVCSFVSDEGQGRCVSHDNEVDKDNQHCIMHVHFLLIPRVGGYAKHQLGTQDS